MRGNRKVVSLALIAGMINSVFYFTGWLSTGWAILVSTLASAIIIELISSKGGNS